MSILHHLASEPRLMAKAHRGRGRVCRRGRGVDAGEDEPPNLRRDQRDREIAARRRRIRELERQLAEARTDAANDQSSQTLGLTINLPEFEGISHPDEFIDWLHTVERVFEVKTLSDDQKVKLVAIKLRKHASIWWEHVRNRRVREGKSKIQSWSKMRQKLIAKFLPAQYRQETFIEYHNLRQGGMSVEQYTSEFDMLRRRCDVVEEKEQTSRGGSVANRRCFECQGLGHLIADYPNRQLVTLVEEDVEPVYDDYEDYDEGLEDNPTENGEVTYADPDESLVVRRALSVTASEEVGIAEAIILATDEIAGHVAVQGQPEDISTVDVPTCESSRMSQEVDKTGERTLAVVTKVDKAPEGLIEKVTADEVKLLGKLQDGTVFVKNGHDEEEPFEFKIDEEQVVDGLDKAVKKMKRGEISLITIHPEYAFGANDSPQELAIVRGNSIMYFEVEMVSFVKEKESWDMNTQEKIEEAGKKKEKGNILFKAGKYVRASKRYEKAVNFIECDFSFSDDEKQQAKLLKVSCNLSNAACKLKLKEYKEAAKHCSKVLKIQSKNVKALYRRAQACIQLVDLDLAELDIKKALEIVKKISDKLAANLAELDKLASLGFSSPGETSTNHYVGIWYKKTSATTSVWVANRLAPLANKYGVLKVIHPGLVVLLSDTNATVWSTNSSKSVQNAVTQLLDTGNFVVRDATDPNPENFLWQSFDYPSDTLLEGMKLGMDLVTGFERYLTSWKSSDDPAPGDYTYHCDPTGYPQNLMRKRANVTFRAGPWNGIRWSGAPNMVSNSVISFGVVMNGMEIYYKYELVNKSVISTFVVKPYGKAMRIIWIGNGQGWVNYHSADADDYDSYKLCGAYGTCNNLSDLFCQMLR